MNNENEHTGKKEIRRKLEGSLRGKFHEATWKRLWRDAREDFCEYLKSSGSQKDDSFGTLRDLAEEKLEYQRELEREVLETQGLLKESLDGSGGDPDDSGRRGVSPTFSVELPERERLRAAVLLEVQMRQAAEHPEVKDFRDRELGGRLLSAEEAEVYFRPHPRQSIADEALADLARRLKEHYGWHQDDAAWFVLTGDTPTFHPLDVSFHLSESSYGPNYGEITLHVTPWVPASEVKKAFLEARDRMRGGAGPGTVSKQRLKVLRFVEEESAKSGQRPPYPALCEGWNQKKPEGVYADYRAFRSAYREARKEVLYPDYRLPDRESTPNIERLQVRIHKRFAPVRAILKKRNQSR